MPYCEAIVRVFVSILLGLTLSGPIGMSGGRAETAPNPASLSRGSAVIVSARIGPHRDAIGAGVIVAIVPFGLRVLTARHVTQSGDVTVWIAGVGYPAEVVRTFDHRDLALVETIVPPGVRAHVRSAIVAADATVDDPIVIWGEDDAGPRVEPGRIVTTHFVPPGDAEARPLVAIECARCAHGDSGGGIFSAAGHLIGILVACYRTPDRHIVATVGEIVDSTLLAEDSGDDQATATAPASTVRSQNIPKLSPD